MSLAETNGYLWWYRLAVTAIIAHLVAVQRPGRLLASDDVLAVIAVSARKILVMEGFARSFIAH